jgi:hypothetical protein
LSKHCADTGATYPCRFFRLRQHVHSHESILVREEETAGVDLRKGALWNEINPFALSLRDQKSPLSYNVTVAAL